MAELSSCDEGHLAHKASDTYCAALYGEGSQTPDLEPWSGKH